MAPSFRFLPAEVAEMEAVANQLNNAATPSRAVLQALADRFSASPDRAGNNNIAVDPLKVFTSFKNRCRRHPQAKPPRYLTRTAAPLQMHTADSSAPPTPAAQHTGSSSGKDHMKGGPPVQFEAKSARDGAWYDVAGFLSERNSENGNNPEVKVRLSGFGAESDEWVDVGTCVRKRSLPFEATECACIDRGDLVLCFQASDSHALYFDAHVTDIQRRRHDVRGCRCRFLIRYDHDQSEEIVMLRKLCRRPELTDHKLQILHDANAAANVRAPPEDTNVEFTSPNNTKR